MAARFPSFAVALPVALLVACVVLPGCKRKLTDANLSCVKMDMSPKEVESILGQPTKSVLFELPLQEDVKTLPGMRYIYEQDGKTVTIHFVDGKLAAQEGSFDQ